MRSRHNGLIQMRKKYWQAIGHHDGAGDAALARQAGVGNQAIDTIKTQFQHTGAVHLLQKDRLTIDGTLQNQSIGCDVNGRITDVVTQVQGVEGRQRNAALTRCEDRMYTCRRRPLRDQPVGVIHCPGRPTVLPV